MLRCHRHDIRHFLFLAERHDVHAVAHFFMVDAFDYAAGDVCAYKARHGSRAAG